MAERFVESAGTISIGTGDDIVIGIGTAFSGRDRAAARLIAYPASGVPVIVGTVAEVDPRGIYDDLSLPLLHPYRGPPLTAVAYELVDGPAIASGATQAAIYARFAAFLEQNMGLSGNLADAIDYSLVPNNTLFVDSATRTIYQWRNGVLEPVYYAGLQFTPRGAWSGLATYAVGDLVSHSAGGSEPYAFVSNINGNLNNEPPISGSPLIGQSDANWTALGLVQTPSIIAVSFSISGRPGSDELVEGIIAVDPFTFRADFSGSQASARIAATADTVFDILVNGAAIGTVTFSAGAVVGTFSLASDHAIEAGDSIDLQCPMPGDATLSGVKINLRGTLNL